MDLPLSILCVAFKFLMTKYGASILRNVHQVVWIIEELLSNTEAIALLLAHSSVNRKSAWKTTSRRRSKGTSSCSRSRRNWKGVGFTSPRNESLCLLVKECEESSSQYFRIHITRALKGFSLPKGASANVGKLAYVCHLIGKCLRFSSEIIDDILLKTISRHDY